MANVIVTIGRLGNYKKVVADESKSIKSVLTENGYTIQSDEKIQDIHGEEFSGNETVEAGCEYYLVQSVKSA